MATKLISILLSAGHLLILRNNCILKHWAHWNCFPSVANLLLLFSGEIGKCTEIRFQEVFHFPDNSHGSLRNCCVLHFSLHWSKLHSFTSKSHSTILFFLCGNDAIHSIGRKETRYFYFEKDSLMNGFVLSTQAIEGWDHKGSVKSVYGRDSFVSSAWQIKQITLCDQLLYSIL